VKEPLPVLQALAIEQRKGGMRQRHARGNDSRSVTFSACAKFTAKKRFPTQLAVEDKVARFSEAWTATSRWFSGPQWCRSAGDQRLGLASSAVQVRLTVRVSRSLWCPCAVPRSPSGRSAARYPRRLQCRPERFARTCDERPFASVQRCRPRLRQQRGKSLRRDASEVADSFSESAAFALLRRLRRSRCASCTGAAASAPNGSSG
jgi:hypothetical protein